MNKSLTIHFRPIIIATIAVVISAALFIGIAAMYLASGLNHLP